MMSYAVDAQYLAGLVWDRSPAVRFAYRPNAASTFAIAFENPEQQVGTIVKFPTALASVLSTQYNTGTAELRTPNTMPDTIIKGSFNFGPEGRRFHIDTGGVIRYFRSYDPANITEHKSAIGVGGNINIGWDLTRRLHLVLNGFLSSGGGRYVGGLIPDVIVRANGDVSPIKAHSWVSGARTGRNSQNDSLRILQRRLCGAKHRPGHRPQRDWVWLRGSNAGRRAIQEWTTGWGQLFWTSESAGSVQLNTQYSYIRNNPWGSGTGPRLSSAHLVLGQVRYNLP
jgi:hypothetical protein